jgi:hypothetical protein
MVPSLYMLHLYFSSAYIYKYIEMISYSNEYVSYGSGLISINLF